MVNLYINMAKTPVRIKKEPTTLVILWNLSHHLFLLKNFTAIKPEHNKTKPENIRKG